MVHLVPLLSYYLIRLVFNLVVLVLAPDMRQEVPCRLVLAPCVRSQSMKDQFFRCKHCKKRCVKRTRDQHYCGSPACQKVRKNKWRRAKYQVDPDYRANQRNSTTAWLKTQGGNAAYYRRYRKQRRHQPGSGDNTSQAPPRLPRPKPIKGTNSDAEMANNPMISGKYWILPCGANSDAVLVKLSIIQGG
jgi:hypothetical protein